MLANIGLYSYGTAVLTYLLLAMLVFASRRGLAIALPLQTASLLTAAWAGITAGSTLLEEPLVELIQMAEIARNASWSFLLLQLIGSRLQGTNHILATKRWVPLWLAAYGLMLALALVHFLPAKILPLSDESRYDFMFSAWLAMAIFNLLLLEQIYRNSSESERWTIKHLCLGLGVMFAYDFFMYAEALLFRLLDANVWQARGIVVSLTAILLAIATSRTALSPIKQTIMVSRHVAFHTVTLLAAGIYLILMAVAGYLIRDLGGNWGGVLQITFLCAAGLLLFLLLFSGQIRASTRVWLSKNFFSYKYDYRKEWLEVTQNLSSDDRDVPKNIIRAIARLIQSTGGLLWVRNEAGKFELNSSWELAEPENADQLGNLPQWIEQTDWIIDLPEWQRAPDIYDGLEVPSFLQKIPKAGLIIPLILGDRLEGFVLLRQSDLQADINWEDRDLLKVAGRQAASHLAQYRATLALVESRQFEAFNRLSAYVIHDLKNILAQQSLIVSNAQKHKHKPAFVDDVITTVENSVDRMTRLMEQMRSGVRGKKIETVSICTLINEAAASRPNATPIPEIRVCDEDIIVEADPEQLLTVFTHIIQNAQEATDKSGQVTIRATRHGDDGIVEIEDTGSGMSEAFIHDRLFKPFDSTKGLTGMGIGAFESREFIRALGGDIQVSSTPGKGSLFRIVLPCSSITIENIQQDGN